LNLHSENEPLQADEPLCVFAVAKKTPYVITAEESKAIFSKAPDRQAQRAMEYSARFLENTCLKKGAAFRK